MKYYIQQQTEYYLCVCIGFVVTTRFDDKLVSKRWI